MALFHFNGDWEFQYNLPAFKGFASIEHQFPSTIQDEIPRSHGAIEISIADDATDSPDPTPAQLKTLDFIIEHQDQIVLSLIQSFRQELQNWLWAECYEWRDEDEFKFELNNASDDLLKSILSPENISISLWESGDLTSFEITGSCEYDCEHGFGCLFNGLTSVKFGEPVFFTGAHRPLKLKESPSEILPHPKYGKLKPWQNVYNKRFVADCAAKGDTDTIESYFKKRTKVELDNHLQSMYFDAIRNDQHETVTYLKSKGRFLPHANVVLYGHRFGPKTAAAFLSEFSDEDKSDFFKKMLDHHITEELNWQKVNSNQQENSPFQHIDHMARLKLIHELSNRDFLTKDFIDKVVQKHRKKNNLGSEKDLESLFYPLILQRPEVAGWDNQRQLEVKNWLLRLTQWLKR